MESQSIFEDFTLLPLQPDFSPPPLKTQSPLPVMTVCSEYQSDFPSPSSTPTPQGSLRVRVPSGMKIAYVEDPIERTSAPTPSRQFSAASTGRRIPSNPSFSSSHRSSLRRVSGERCSGRKSVRNMYRMKHFLPCQPRKIPSPSTHQIITAAGRTINPSTYLLTPPTTPPRPRSPYPQSNRYPPSASRRVVESSPSPNQKNNKQQAKKEQGRRGSAGRVFDRANSTVKNALLRMRSASTDRNTQRKDSLVMRGFKEAKRRLSDASELGRASVGLFKKQKSLYSCLRCESSESFVCAISKQIERGEITLTKRNP